MVVAGLGDRFWSKVDASGDCWEWTGALNKPGGYGRVPLGSGSYAYAHRLAYAEAHGPIPEGMDVLHHCDNPPCCNSEHLFLGTAKDNAADMVRKGRAGYWARPGDLNPAARLTWPAVRVIRSRHHRGETITDLAQEFGVDRTTVNLVVLGRTWKETAT